MPSVTQKITLFVPGRLCLFGEHSDWAGKYRTMNADIVPGKAIVTGIEQGIEATAERAEQFILTSDAPEINQLWKDFSCAMDSVLLKSVAHSGSFFSYCAGVASYMLEWYSVGGIHIHLTKMALPMKSGLSSSAAICVLVARAFNQLYNLNLNTMGEMNIAYVGELRTASRCGRLDQACAFGVKPVLMTFDGEEIEVNPLTVRKPLYWVFADLCASKDTIRILADLNKGYPFASNEQEEKEHLALGQQNDEIITRATKLIQEGNAEELGRLMTSAQQLFDENIAPLCPSQLQSPKLHSVLADEYIHSLTYGGKGVGSQGDGSIQFLARDEESQQQLIKYLEKNKMKAYALTIQPRHVIRKAIIPVAGFGTRLYPATRMLKKDFFPIVDSDGLVKPVILILLEELVRSGIEEICIVIGNDDERRQYRDFFERKLTDEHLSKLNNQCQDYENRIIAMGKRLHFVYQHEKRGFGHAVYQCSLFAGNEPVLLLLGDTIYKSHSNKPCCLQFIEQYERFNKPMIAIHPIPLNTVSHYGIITGVWENKEETVMSMTALCEKPTEDYAETNLKTRTKHSDANYYSVFGQYILTPEVFRQLQRDIDTSTDSAQEIELTSALEKVRKQYGMMGVILDGEMFDMGNPAALKNLIQNY